MNSSRQRSLSGRRAISQQKGHIVQESLNRKSQLIDKYQNEIQDLIGQVIFFNQNQQIETKMPIKRSSTHANNNNGSAMERSTKLRSIKRNRLSVSMRNDSVQPEKETILMTGSAKDYQKLILGLQYALQSERKKAQSLQQKNNSLQVEISNLRNMLMGPNEVKQYQKTILKQMQQKMNQSEDKFIDQKKNYEFIIDSKNQAITSLQTQLRTLQKQYSTSAFGANDKEKKIMSHSYDTKQNTLTKKILDLMNTMQELRTTITQKNIQIQSLRYRKIDYHPDIDDESDSQIKKINTIQKTRFYLQQLQIANKMIIKKNIQILNLGSKVMKYQQVIDLIEMYLDKRQVKNVDLNVLETPVITKLRILLREKATFQRELLGQLNQHNKKITHFQSQLTSKESLATVKLSQTIADNKKLSSLVSTLHLNIKNLEKSLHDEKRQNQYLKNEVEINKKQFIDEMKKVKGDLGTISSVTKNEFDRMKLENLKLSEQNRSLLFLVGEKQRDLHRKGQTIKTFQDYKQKINSLDTSIVSTQRRKVQKSVEQSPQLGSKILLISNFSGWLFEWKKIKSWANKKVLLNLILDRQEIRTDAISQIHLLIEVLHECLLQSRNIQVQQRGIILIRYFIEHNILQHKALYLDKLVPILVRGFRQRIQGQQQDKIRLLNESALKIFSELQKQKYVWTNELTNEMLAVNGLKYLFALLNSSSIIDDLIEMVYDVLIMVIRQNQMVSFIVSYNLPEIILKNLHAKYTFIVYLLQLLKCLLQSDDFLRSQKSLLQYRKLVLLLKQVDDEELVMLALQCLEILMKGSSSTFMKAMNKIQAVSYLNALIKSSNDVKLLKKVAFIYGLIIEGMDDDSVDKFIKQQFGKLLQLISQKNISQYQFVISLKIALKVTEQITEYNELDDKIISTCFQLYELYESLQQKSRMRLNQIVDTIYQRNKVVINKFTSNTFITNLVESYKSTNVVEQVLILLKILLFLNQQKQTTELLRSGRQSFIQKLISESMSTKNYQLSILALKNLLAIARQKYVEKFMNVKIIAKIVNKVLKQRTQEEYLGLAVSVLYFISKNEPVSQWVVEAKGVERVTEVMMERHDKEPLMIKCFALLQLLHSTNYKKKVLNYFLTDLKLQSTKTFNYILRRAQNKQEMGARAVFYYDFLLQKSSIQSLVVSMVENQWMIQDLISTRNQYIGKVDSLVYKIQVILNQVCARSKKLNRIYQRFKVEGDISSGDEGQ